MTQIIPWRPFDELSRLRKDMDHLWSRLIGAEQSFERDTKDWLPTLDVSTTDEEIHVRAELPGLEAKDIEVTVSGDRLTLKGKKNERHNEEGKYYIRQESYFGVFQRTVQLPSEVEAEGVEANFKNGVLTVTLPKSEQLAMKKIEVNNN